MDIDFAREFGPQLARLKKEAEKSERGSRRLELLTFMLRRLQTLDGKPSSETATFKRVRQSRAYEVWRVSHPFEKGIALRIICWFPPEKDTVVVTLFAGEKAAMGDVFYDSVGTRADQIITRWLQEEERGLR